MAAFGFLLALLIPIGIVGAVGAVVYFLVKGNQGAGEGMTFRNLLRAYLRFAYMVSLVVFLVGAVFTLTATLSYVFGHDFSYSSYSYASGPVTAPAPCKSGDPYASPTPGGCAYTQPPQPPDQRPQDDLIRGISMMVAGLVLGGGHRLGQRAMENGDERRHSMLARAESLVGTVGFGVTSIVAIPLATYDILRYVILGTQNVNGGTAEVPGGALAVALVFGPAWAFYLVTFVRAARRSAEPTPA